MVKDLDVVDKLTINCKWGSFHVKSVWEGFGFLLFTLLHGRIMTRRIVGLFCWILWNLHFLHFVFNFLNLFSWNRLFITNFKFLNRLCWWLKIVLGCLCGHREKFSFLFRTVIKFVGFIIFHLSDNCSNNSVNSSIWRVLKVIRSHVIGVNNRVDSLLH